MRSDDELYSRFLAGTDSAYDELMCRYGDSLVCYLYGYLHSWEDAEDLMIEAFARIMVKRPAIGEGKIKAYLYKTARNLAARFHERSRRAELFSLDGMETEPADGTDLAGMHQTKERRRILHECLGRIDPALREALWLIYFEDMTYAQAGMVMGLNDKKIDRLLAKGKKQLRQELEKEGITNAFE